jgi:hypothetical protein
MQFMVIETFKAGKKEQVYERYEQKGRVLPKGLAYINSWVEVGGNRCFQLMQTENRELFDEWIAAWKDLVDFEVIPIEVSHTNSE